MFIQSAYFIVVHLFNDAEASHSTGQSTGRQFTDKTLIWITDMPYSVDHVRIQWISNVKIVDRDVFESVWCDLPFVFLNVESKMIRDCVHVCAHTTGFSFPVLIDDSSVFDAVCVCVCVYLFS